MRLPAPTPPPYDPFEWQQLPYAERLRLACQAWAIQGYGTPWPVYLVYLFKVGFFIGGWLLFCSLTPGLGGVADIGSWWAKPLAFQKAIVWSMTFEGLGLGCGSGPLTGRYHPPLGGALYFLRPGTTKLPLVAGIPLLGGHKRSWFDVALYVAHYAFLIRALLAPELSVDHFVPTLVLLPLLGITDKTIFLIARSEHYLTAMVCFLFASDWVAGSKAVWLAIWLWAATSKLNHHFPAVVGVMTSNSPLLSSQRLRKRMYRSYPDDLRPSQLAAAMAHVGTAIEYTFPLVLALSSSAALTSAALAVMLGFHCYITSNIPMAVPIEWNVSMVYGAFVLFGEYAQVRVWSIEQPLLIAFLVAALLVTPLVGNIWPRLTSFLVAMRYYAGNWAYSVWLFRGESRQKLDALTKSSPWVTEQLARFYDEPTIIGLMGKVPAFRAMHLHGRALQLLLPKAVDDIEAYEYVDGEIIAGIVIGWNFGDGHLHDEQLLAAVQAQCGFEPGELRCIFVESQPLGRSWLSWRIVDAAAGERDRGRVAIDRLRELQPWSTDEPVATEQVQ